MVIRVSNRFLVVTEKSHEFYILIRIIESYFWFLFIEWIWCRYQIFQWQNGHFFEFNWIKLSFLCYFIKFCIEFHFLLFSRKIAYEDVLKSLLCHNCHNWYKVNIVKIQVKFKDDLCESHRSRILFYRSCIL